MNVSDRHAMVVNLVDGAGQPGNNVFDPVQVIGDNVLLRVKGDQWIPKNYLVKQCGTRHDLFDKEPVFPNLVQSLGSRDAREALQPLQYAKFSFKTRDSIVAVGIQSGVRS